MRLATVDNRAKLIVDGSAVDIEEASDGRFGPNPGDVFDHWERFAEWASTADISVVRREPFDEATAGPPSPSPRQVFAVALNYRAHAAESGTKPPDNPLFFTKYVSAFSGPVTEVTLPEGRVDWECELVAVIGKLAHNIDPGEAWSYVAGLTVGQDISERLLQRSGPVPQFGLAKSYPGFAPTGPVLVTPDELADPDDLAIGCAVNDQVMQDDRTSRMIFPVPALIAYLSTVVTLLSGDVIFTGTPPGVGMGRNPQVWLSKGDHLRSWIEGIGELHQSFV